MQEAFDKEPFITTSGDVDGRLLESIIKGFLGEQVSGNEWNAASQSQESGVQALRNVTGANMRDPLAHKKN